MPQLSAASSRDRPSKTSAIASIRRAALAARVRAASRRKSPAGQVSPRDRYRHVRLRSRSMAERITAAAQTGSRPSHRSRRLVLLSYHLTDLLTLVESARLGCWRADFSGSVRSCERAGFSACSFGGGLRSVVRDGEDLARVDQARVADGVAVGG